MGVPMARNMMQWKQVLLLSVVVVVVLEYVTCFAGLHCCRLRHQPCRCTGARPAALLVVLVKMVAVVLMVMVLTSCSCWWRRAARRLAARQRQSQTLTLW